MRLAAELEVHVYVHTWLQVGGTPRLPGGGNRESESTPMDLARLAQRFPQVSMICGHSGGDWELGVRAIRPYKNILLEFAGSDPHSGMAEYAIRELGVDRLVWGGHGPSRSYATELGKVLDADISKADRMKIFGANLRRITASIFRKKAIRIEP
jgi:predicted TIM-barrel fold metal-dependent hydrolase